MNPTELTAAAGLLHDIGKFWQRARGPNDRPVDERLWTHLQQYLPKKADGTPSHTHAAWSAAFVHEVMRAPDSPEKESLARIIASHHKPDALNEETERRIALAVSLGDWLSSGERREDEVVEEAGPTAAILRSIFGQTSLGGCGSATGGIVSSSDFPLARRTDFSADHFFPIQTGTAANTLEAYAECWQALENDACALGARLLNVDALYSLLSQHTIRIPAATPWQRQRTIPDISLFDHSRIAAAVATCLTAAGLSESQLRELQREFQSERDTSAARPPLFRLIGGDMSGIQRFIYNLTGDHAARTLKGRSFFVQILCEAVADFVCEQLGLSRVCQLYCSGGRFYLLAPYDGPALASLQQSINEKLVKHFHGALVVVLGQADLGLRDFKLNADAAHAKRTGIAAKWREVARAADRAKRRKLSQLARANYGQVFDTLDEAGPINRCPVCRAEHNRTADDPCALCESFSKLGQDLRKAEYLLFLRPADAPPSNDEPPSDAAPPSKDASRSNNDYNAVLAEFGCRVRAADTLDLTDAEAEHLKAVVSINRYDPSLVARKLSKTAAPLSLVIGYRLLGTHFPESPNPESRGGLKTFEELANEAAGDPKLGILRADLDDLGRLFADGLGPYATFARVAALSRTLGDFFDGYISHLLQNETYCVARTPADAPTPPSPESLPFAERRFADATALIYSGGDDLFLVGAWDAVVEAASRIQRDFRRYVGPDHPNFTLSCGIAVVQPKFPILLAAELAGEAESASKRFAGNGNGIPPKNALTLFGATASWKCEFEQFELLKNRIVYLLSPGQAKRPLPQGFLRKLYGVWGTWQNEALLLRRELECDGRSPQDIEQRLRWSRWRWLLVYSLRQYARDDNQNMVEEIQRMIQDNGIESRLGLPLRWAELILKGGA
ncbi:MAG: type III-A CRISPR-associated protein Cas10/Csm1 [Candidatus Sumerlaeia bacterium]|nr:type III-A CRISPR-associated protein Cas10/Csm1 [Candidatus Sumerlaeia bacterium]